MDLKTLLQEYCIYNEWANRRLIEWLSVHPDSTFDQTIASSFPSLRATVLHVWGAEHIWLQRLQGHPHARFIAMDFTGTNPEACDNLLQASAAFRDFMLMQDAAYFSDGQTHYVHHTGKEYNQSNAEIILHCMQHSTYHRGQLVTMARNLGIIDPPATDYILYIRNRDNA